MLAANLLLSNHYRGCYKYRLRDRLHMRERERKREIPSFKCENYDKMYVENHSLVVDCHKLLQLTVLVVSVYYILDFISIIRSY